MAHGGGIGYALAKEQQSYVTWLVKAGRFNNQSEAGREAIRRMQAQEMEYLTPPPLTSTQLRSIYGGDTRQESAVAQATFHSFRSAARKGFKP